MSKLRTTAEQYMPVYCILVHVGANMEVRTERVAYDVHMPTKLDNFVFYIKHQDKSASCSFLRIAFCFQQVFLM
jgi:hypothetical protein